MIHETACVDAGAMVGDGTMIWHFCHVRESAKIGRDCVLGQNVYVDAKVEIGDGVKIQNNVSVYQGVVIEDDVFLGPSCVFTNVGRPRSRFPTDTAAYAPTVVAQGATIGANATIICGVTIGAWALVGAGAVVSKDVKPHSMVLGVPARHCGWVCKCGRALEFPDVIRPSTVCECGREFDFDGSGVTER